MFAAGDEEVTAIAALMPRLHSREDTLTYAQRCSSSAANENIDITDGRANQCPKDCATSKHEAAAVNRQMAHQATRQLFEPSPELVVCCRWPLHLRTEPRKQRYLECSWVLRRQVHFEHIEQPVVILDYPICISQIIRR